MTPKGPNTASSAADRVVFYAEASDVAALRGAFVEAGMCMMLEKPTVVVLKDIFLGGDTKKPVGSWIRGKDCYRADTVEEALALPVAFLKRW